MYFWYGIFYRTVKFIYSEKGKIFAKSSPYFWLQYIQSKVKGRIRKILWPSQNIWTLLTMMLATRPQGSIHQPNLTYQDRSITIKCYYWYTLAFSEYMNFTYLRRIQLTTKCCQNWRTIFISGLFVSNNNQRVPFGS